MGGFASDPPPLIHRNNPKLRHGLYLQTWIAYGVQQKFSACSGIHLNCPQQNYSFICIAMQTFGITLLKGTGLCSFTTSSLPFIN